METVTMMSIPMLLICIAAFAVIIWASTKFKINIGILALFFAFLIGYWGMGLSLSTIYKQWPANITIMYMGIAGMFYPVRKTGALDLLGRKLIYKSRNVPWMICLSFAVVCALLGFLGADVTSMMALFAVIGLDTLHKVGVKPLAAFTSIALGCGCLSIWPWTTNGNFIFATMTQWYTAEEATSMVYDVSWRVFLPSFVFIIIIIIATRAYKIDPDKLILVPPEPFNKEQKTAMKLVFIPVAISVVMQLAKTFITTVPVLTKVAGYCQLYVLAYISIIIAILIKATDGLEVIEKGMPWRIILLTGGMICFINVMTQAGMPQTIAHYMNQSIPVAIMLPVFTFAGAVMSCFAGATTTAFAMLFAIAVPISQNTGIDIAALTCAILGGTMATGIAPFSTGGATMQAYCEVEEWQANNRLFKTALIAVILNAVNVLIWSALGLHSGAVL